jgi:hypothetical protein
MRRHLRLFRIALVSLTLLAIPELHADVTLRYTSEVTLNPSLPPQITQQMKQMPAGRSNPFGAGFDPDTALAQVTQELAEISTASIPDSVFQVPEGYRSVPAVEIIKDMLAKTPAAAR